LPPGEACFCNTERGLYPLDTALRSEEMTSGELPMELNSFTETVMTKDLRNPILASV
jgi:hypothetical protein